MHDREALIVVAHSARALAVSAARAGYAPLAIDLFGDSDTREASLAVIALQGPLSGGLAPDAVALAVQALRDDHHPIGLVYGSGFEHQPQTIASLARQIPILGNDADVVSRAKDPQAFADLCAALGIRFPEIALWAPSNATEWLVKRRGGAGGAHVRPAREGETCEDGRYFQRRVDGHGVSALFLSDGSAATLVGLSVQWTSPTVDGPFRYGGAAGPATVDPAVATTIMDAILKLAIELGLRGLNSADFLVASDGVHLVDLNPRPGATLDVFDRIDDPLIARHVAACRGQTSPNLSIGDGRAAEVAYAPEEMIAAPRVDWPDWVADRPMPGTRIAPGDPLCTVLAVERDCESARALAAARARQAISLLRDRRHE
jgi:predicted ATP-grasp superfamily ATP-dependent carboligase